VGPGQAGPHWRAARACRRRAALAPGRRGTYDEDNPAPTLKAVCDGLVDARVVADDDRARMGKRVEIHDPVRSKRGALWLTVQVLA
jgi:hypothetical protein